MILTATHVQLGEGACTIRYIVKDAPNIGVVGIGQNKAACEEYARKTIAEFGAEEMPEVAGFDYSVVFGAKEGEGLR
jgi:hypothetical protein